MSKPSNLSHPGDTVYFDNHYYKILIYPSSVTGYEESKSYAKRACSDLYGYPAVLDVGEESEFVGEFIAKFQNEHPDEKFFVCERDN